MGNRTSISKPGLSLKNFLLSLWSTTQNTLYYYMWYHRFVICSFLPPIPFFPLPTMWSNVSFSTSISAVWTCFLKPCPVPRAGCCLNWAGYKPQVICWMECDTNQATYIMGTDAEKRKSHFKKHAKWAFILHWMFLLQF